MIGCKSRSVGTWPRSRARKRRTGTARRAGCSAGCAVRSVRGPSAVAVRPAERLNLALLVEAQQRTLGRCQIEPNGVPHFLDEQAAFEGLKPSTRYDCGPNAWHIRWIVGACPTGAAIDRND